MKSIPDTNQTAVLIRTSKTILAPYKLAATRRKLSLNDLLTEALLMYSIEHLQAQTEEEEAKEVIELREERIIHYIRKIETNNAPPSVRDLGRYMTDLDVLTIKDELHILVAQGKIKEIPTNHTTRYTAKLS